MAAMVKDGGEENKIRGKKTSTVWLQKSTLEITTM